ncbi:alkaline phosphatase family protein [Hwanghaeella sp.]|uniref:alkaline phosphatase family protein n=1 Tax=Hwanghaeella sp. TaxID=2605943 RepID=UPI003CCC27E0
MAEAVGKPGGVRNVLFIMADQFRWDYLGCAGHPTLSTPALDGLARRGVRFTNAYAQSAICGPSRMSFYSGLYLANHGATLNGVPLPVGVKTLGDYLRPLGVRTALAGKTHMAADRAGIDRLGLTGMEGVFAAQAGFEPYQRDDGLNPTGFVDPDLAYNSFLRQQGYDGENPWHDFANAAEGPDGEILSGWVMRHANLPARVKQEHSETPWMTDQAIRFIRDQGDEPWCLHLSYIKPHWPYIAPAPYHDMYSPADINPPIRSEAERRNPHPVVAAFMRHDESVNFAEQVVRDRVVPTYMGLVQQLDDALGRLFTELEKLGRWDDTLVVFTADHGDYLGDHWLGEKELFHDSSSKIPMIVAGPGLQKGLESDHLVEAIDLVPTFIDALGGEVPAHELDGRSLMPLLRGEDPAEWRDIAVAELDYAVREARRDLGLDTNQARAWMIRTDRWKYIEYLGFPPQLFDLYEDPDELVDLGEDGHYNPVCAELRERLFDWFQRRKMRRTMSDATVEARTSTWKSRGITFGEW